MKEKIEGVVDVVIFPAWLILWPYFAHLQRQIFIAINGIDYDTAVVAPNLIVYFAMMAYLWQRRPGRRTNLFVLWVLFWPIFSSCFKLLFDLKVGTDEFGVFSLVGWIFWIVVSFVLYLLSEDEEPERNTFKKRIWIW